MLVMFVLDTDGSYHAPHITERMRTLHLNRAVIFSLALAGNAVFAGAQTNSSEGASVRSEIFAGSVSEDYLRYLQTIGMVPLYPWSSRGFSARELDKLIPTDTAHPWSSRLSPE